jgi:2-dehydro-3-deoxygluconokinase
MQERPKAAKRVVTFGEIMMRLSPPDHLRFGQARQFDLIYAGGEANVAASLANYGIPVDYVTRLPRNDLGLACVRFLQGHGINADKIVFGGDRIGIFFLEHGAAQRGSKVVYDRANSALATIEPGMIDWRSVFADAEWFHWTGITPAVSRGAAEAQLEAVKVAREMGLTISFDLNYRSALWKWGRKPGDVMSEIVPYCDVAIGNEEDTEAVFGIKAPDSDFQTGKVEAESYRAVCEQMKSRFPNLKVIATTLRGSISASHNTWSGVLWEEGKYYTAPTYDIDFIVDRVGGGDSFVGGLIHGFRAYGDDRQKALNFAVAASCLKHSVWGDFNGVTVAEVERIMGGVTSGRVSR